MLLDTATLAVNFRSDLSVVQWVNDVFSVLLGGRDDPSRSLVAFSPAAPRPGAPEGVGVELLVWTDRPAVEGLEGKEREAAVKERRDAMSKGAAADEVEAVGLADWIAGEVAERRLAVASVDPASKRGAASIAVLVRARAHALPLLRALERRAPSVRVRAPGLDRLADRPVVLDLLAITRALLHRGDRLAWLAVLRSPWVGLDLDDLARLVEVDVAAATSSSKWTPVPALLRDVESQVAELPDGRPRVSEDGRRRIARWMAIATAATAAGAATETAAPAPATKTGAAMAVHETRTAGPTRASPRGSRRRTVRKGSTSASTIRRLAPSAAGMTASAAHAAGPA